MVGTGEGLAGPGASNCPWGSRSEARAGQVGLGMREGRSRSRMAGMVEGARLWQREARWRLKERRGCRRHGAGAEMKGSAPEIWIGVRVSEGL